MEKRGKYNCYKNLTVVNMGVIMYIWTKYIYIYDNHDCFNVV